MRATFPKTGKVLKKIREREGFSQAALAKAVGCHPQFVSNWERGLCMPPKHCHKTLARVLCIDALDNEKIFAMLKRDSVKNLRDEFWGLV